MLIKVTANPRQARRADPPRRGLRRPRRRRRCSRRSSFEIVEHPDQARLLRGAACARTASRKRSARAASRMRRALGERRDPRLRPHARPRLMGPGPPPYDYARPSRQIRTRNLDDEGLLRRRRRPLAARRQDRRDPRLRLAGPRPRAQPQGLRRRRRRRPARRTPRAAPRPRRGPRGARRRRRGQPRRRRDDPAARREAGRGLGGEIARRHRRRATCCSSRHGFSIHFGEIEPPAGRRRRHGRAQGPRPPGPPPVHARARAFPCLIAIHQDATGNAQTLALAYAKGIGGTARRRHRDDLQGRDRDRPVRRAGGALRRRHASWSRPASRRWSRPATTRGSPTSSACTS